MGVRYAMSCSVCVCVHASLSPDCLAFLPAALLQAVESEGVDMLVVSVNGERPISKEIDELLRTVKTSILIFRYVSQACLRNQV